MSLTGYTDAYLWAIHKTDKAAHNELVKRCLINDYTRKPTVLPPKRYADEMYVSSRWRR
jgi:hypothetical protein